MPAPGPGRNRVRERFGRIVERLTSPSLLAYAVSGGAAIASFIATVILARTSGPETVGHYALAAATANLLSLFAVFGLDRIITREIGGDLRVGLGGQARATLYGTARFVLMVSAAVTIAYLAVIVFTTAAGRLGADRPAMVVAASGILVWPMLRITYGALRGAGHPIIGQIVESLPTYLFTTAIVTVALIGRPIDAALATALFVGMQLIVTTGAWLNLNRRARRWDTPSDAAADAPPPAPTIKYWVVGLPLMVMVFVQTSAEWLLLAQISGSVSAADTGAYRAAFQVITIASLVIATSESFVSGPIAGDFRIGRADLAWGHHRRATILMLAIASPFLLAAMIVPELIIVTIFGPKFAVAATPLAIMAFGQLLNVMRGPIGAIIIMSGNERVQLIITFASFAILLACSLTLIPRLGLNGAAIAYSAATGFRAIAFYIAARRYVPAIATR